MPARCHERRDWQGRDPFREGDPGDRLYVIEEGKIKLGPPRWSRRPLAVIGPGEMIGELSLFDPGPRAATATALTDVVAREVGHDALRPCSGRPEVAEALLTALAQRLAAPTRPCPTLSSDVPGRVAKAPLDLGERFWVPVEGGGVGHHDMTQEELAQLVGASRETVNKALADRGSVGGSTRILYP